MALAASNINILGNDQVFDDLKEIKPKETDDNIRWLNLDHICTEKTFYSSVNVEEKKMLVLN